MRFEDTVDKITGVRTVHAYPRTASVVIWYAPKRCETAALLQAIAAAQAIPAQLVPTRSPRSADIHNADVLRMALGAVALGLLGIRRYGLSRPRILGPTSRTFATGATIITGYPFLRGALRSLRGGRSPGTDLLVSAATIASLILRENVVALTVLWLLNIGEYLQDLTLRRTRRAIADLLRGAQDTAWLQLEDGSEVQVSTDSLCVGDVVIIHEQVAIPIDGDVLSGDAVIDQSAITGENLPATVTTGATVHAGSVVVRGRVVVRARAVGHHTVLGRIVARVEEAQRDRAPIQTVGENFSRRFVPASFLLATATFLATGDVRRAMTMLLVACPCAVGLATPTAISAAIGNGARRGIRHQRWLPPRGGRPRECGGLRQDRHAHPRPAHRHQCRVIP
ncbi:cation-translocating P-type ATPase [Mycolicibacterium aubagnense]